MPRTRARRQFLRVRVVPLTQVGLVVEAVDEVGVVRLERGPFGADARDLQEVVPGRRGGRRPLQGVPVAPRVIAQRQLPVLPGLHHVVEERDRGGPEDERPDGGDDVERGEPVGDPVVGVAAGHALSAEPVLHQERHVEADEGQPEVQLAQPLVHHPAAHLREPEVDAAIGGEHDGAEHDVVEVGDHEVGVGDLPVQRRAGQQHTGQAAQQEGDQEAEGEQHRRLEGQLPLPHGADPVHELDAGRHRDQVGEEGEEGQQHRAGGEHVVRPHRQRQGADGEGREDHALVAEQRLAAEHRDDLADDPEERQGDDVDLGVAEEPEQVLPQHGAAVLPAVDQRPQVPVGQHRHQRRGQDREGQQDQHAGDQGGPDEDRHPEQRHARRPQAHDRGDEVDPTEDRAQPGDGQPGHPEVAAGTRRVRDVRQRRVGGPPEIGRPTRGEEPGQHERAAEQEQPERQRVQPRERDIGRADLQRHDQVAEREEQRRREHQQHHRAVHGEQLVVLLRRQELQTRLAQLGPHQHGHQAADDEHDERGHQVHQADGLVVGRPQHVRQPRTLRGDVSRARPAHDRLRRDGGHARTARGDWASGCRQCCGTSGSLTSLDRALEECGQLDHSTAVSGTVIVAHRGAQGNSVGQISWPFVQIS